TPGGIAHHEVASEVAEQGVLEGDPVEAIHVWAGGGDERREMPAVTEEIPDGLLGERGLGVPPIVGLADLLMRPGRAEIQVLENLHQSRWASTPPEAPRRSRDGRNPVGWLTLPVLVSEEEFQGFPANEVEQLRPAIRRGLNVGAQAGVDLEEVNRFGILE